MFTIVCVTEHSGVSQQKMKIDATMKKELFSFCKFKTFNTSYSDKRKHIMLQYRHNVIGGVDTIYPNSVLAIDFRLYRWRSRTVSTFH